MPEERPHVHNMKQIHVEKTCYTFETMLTKETAVLGEDGVVGDIQCFAPPKILMWQRRRLGWLLPLILTRKLNAFTFDESVGKKKKQYLKVQESSEVLHRLFSSF